MSISLLWLQPAEHERAFVRESMDRHYRGPHDEPNPAPGDARDAAPGDQIRERAGKARCLV